MQPCLWCFICGCSETRACHTYPFSQGAPQISRNKKSRCFFEGVQVFLSPDQSCDASADLHPYTHPCTPPSRTTTHPPAGQHIFPHQAGLTSAILRGPSGRVWFSSVFGMVQREAQSPRLATVGRPSRMGPNYSWPSSQSGDVASGIIPSSGDTKFWRSMENEFRRSSPARRGVAARTPTRHWQLHERGCLASRSVGGPGRVRFCRNPNFAVSFETGSVQRRSSQSA